MRPQDDCPLYSLALAITGRKQLPARDRLVALLFVQQADEAGAAYAPRALSALGRSPLDAALQDLRAPLPGQDPLSELLRGLRTEARQ